MVHEMELLGKTKVKVKDEQVVETGEPLIEWCPLFDKVRGIKRVTSEAASGNMAFRIKQHGMFSPRRKLEMDTFVGFGASESMMTGLIRGIIDATVTVCDGAGTVITDNPSSRSGHGRLDIRSGGDRPHPGGDRGHRGPGRTCALSRRCQDRPVCGSKVGCRWLLEFCGHRGRCRYSGEAALTWRRRQA